MSATDFAHITIDNLEKKAKNIVDFMRLQATQCKPVVPVGEYMDLQTVALMAGNSTGEMPDCETAYTVRSKLSREGKLQFPLTADTPNVLMVAFKELIKGNLRYLDEAERAVKEERERQTKGTRSALNVAFEDLQLEDSESAGSCNRISSEGESELPPLVCLQSQSKRKSSMHVKTTIKGTKISALVDTGATDSFIQQVTLTKLGLSDLLQPSTRQVVFGNDQTETVRGRIQIPLQVDGKETLMDAYSIEGKGPSLIIGFKYLKQHGFKIDCKTKRLIADNDEPIQCYRAVATDTSRQQKNC